MNCRTGWSQLFTLVFSCWSGILVHQCTQFFVVKFSRTFWPWFIFKATVPGSVATIFNLGLYLSCLNHKFSILHQSLLAKLSKQNMPQMRDFRHFRAIIYLFIYFFTLTCGYSLTDTELPKALRSSLSNKKILRKNYNILHCLLDLSHK